MVNSWSNDIVRAISFRVGHMHIGDSLVGYNKDIEWRIDYVSVSGETPSYVFYKDGKEIFSRKRNSSVINALGPYFSNMPDMQLVEGDSLDNSSGADHFEEAVPQFELISDNSVSFLRSVVSFWRIRPEFINRFRFVLKRGSAW